MDARGQAADKHLQGLRMMDFNFMEDLKRATANSLEVRPSHSEDWEREAGVEGKGLVTSCLSPLSLSPLSSLSLSPLFRERVRTAVGSLSLVCTGKWSRSP